MFDIGFLELLLVAVVGLLVLGPQRLPQAARTLGLYIGRIKRSVAGIQQEVNQQLQLEEMRQRLAEHEQRVKAGLVEAEQEIVKEAPVSDDLPSTPDSIHHQPSEPAASTAEPEPRISSDHTSSTVTKDTPQ